MTRHHSDRWQERGRGPWRPRGRGRAEHRAWRKHQRILARQRHQALTDRHQAINALAKFRYSSCERKARYRTAAQAQAHTANGSTIYPCRFCDGYHTTLKPTEETP